MTRPPPRNGLDPRSLSQLHTDVVFLLLGLTVAAVLMSRAAGVPATVRRAAATLLAVELAQGLIGFVQYFTGLPVAVVAAHLLGAALVSAALTWLLVSVRERTGSAGQQRVERDRDEQQREVHVRPVEQPHRLERDDVVGVPRPGAAAGATRRGTPRRATTATTG